MDEKNSDRINNDKAKEIQKLLVNPGHLSLLEKQVVESFQTTDSKNMPNVSILMEETIIKMDSKPQSLYDKNMFNIQELYETQNVKNANENYVQSLLEKQMQNLKSASFTNEKNKQFINDRGSVDYNFDTGNLMNGSDPRIFELRLPENHSDILNEKFTLIPTDSQISQGNVLDHLSTVKEIENDKNISLNIDKQYVSKSNKYMLIRTIGRGNFAKVKLAKHMTTDKFVAIKIIDKTKLSSKILSKVSREVKLMKELNHPNIVKLLEVMENESTLYLVMEYASGGELFDYLIIHGCMKEKEARLKFRQMISAVHYCHSKFIVHRDLKAENMLLNSKMEIKIVDFGFANNFNPKSKLSTFCGSPPYAAPELFLGQRYVGPEVDVWSLGVILFTLVSGRLPFDANTLKELKDKVLNLRYEFPYFISNDCESLLRKILTINPKERATLSDLMNDPWINGGGLLHLTPHIETTEINVDNRKLNKLIVMGYEREYAIKSVTEKKFNAVYATYQLLSISSFDSYNKKVDDKSKRQALGFSEKEQKQQAKSQKDLTESNSDYDKTPKEISSRSITGNSVNQFAKSFKKWFKQKTENMDTLTPEETLDSFRGNIMNKEFQKQFQLAQSLDPNASLPIGANQQALIATLNQMSWSKTGKAAMFQQHSIGSIQQPVTEKNQITAAPISWMADHFSRKTSPETREFSKFTVENVKITHSSPTVKSTKSDISDNITKTSSQIKNIKSKMTEAFSGKIKQNDDEKSTNNEISLSRIKKIIEKCDIEKTKLTEKLKPYFIGKDDFSEFLKSHKHQQDENDIFSSKNKPRIGRFAFSMNTISSKDPDLLIEEVIRVLKENEFNYEHIEKYLLLCWNTTVESDTFTDSIQWEMEICRIPLLYVHGVRMKRIFGSSFAYKIIALKITRSLKL